MAGNPLLATLGIEHPVILAPMAGGASTPELVAAVSNAGGLGSFGAAYLPADQVSAAIRRIRTLTSRPFNVNLFAGGDERDRHMDPAPMLAVLAEIHEALGLTPPVLPPFPPNTFPEALEVILEERPAVFSFTFGVPDRQALARLRARGIIVAGTATTVEEAKVLAEAGVDIVVAQGEEAGAHRGTFVGPFEAAMVPALDLVRAIRGAVSVPVVAAGGLMDGHDIAAAMACGASAASLGTAFLPCPESGTPETHKRALLAARQDTTVITRVFSGRPARGLTNTFITRLQGKDRMILPFPLQNQLTRAMRAAAAQQGNAEFLSLWAGRGVTRARALPAGKLVKQLLDEMHQAEQT